MMTHKGSCHCGAIAVELETKVAAAEMELRTCQCEFCRMHQALAVSDPEGSLTITEVLPNALNLYRFALATSDFLICKQCGAYAGAIMESAGRKVGILNIQLLNDEAKFTSKSVAMDYGAENYEGRIRRRLVKWMPVKLLQHEADEAQ